jgi:superfamily II RNA helicase
MPVVSAYQCDECGSLYLAEKKFNTCIESHNEERSEKEKKEAEENAWYAFANYARLNATSWDHLSELLLQQMRTLDPKATLEIRISGIQNVVTSHSQPIGGIRYIYHPRTTEQEENNKNAIYPAARGAIRGKFSISNGTDFSSWVRNNIKGINTGTGGGVSKGGFSYEVTLYIQDFPLILDKFIKFKELEQENHIYLEKKKKLDEEYNDYYYFKCYSDPTHAAYTMELNELENKVKDLKELIAARKIELDDERNARTNPPITFDVELYTNLKREFEK